MKVLILGGSGYLGSNLCKLLIEKNIDFTVFDEKKTNFDLNYFEGCIEYKYDLKWINKTDKFTHIIHLAALSGVEKSRAEYKNYFETNIKGTFNLLDVMAEYNIKNLIFTSSCAVYGNNFDCKESDELKPLSFYGVSKKINEEMIQFYAAQYKINAKILRIFNVVGNGGDSIYNSNRLIPKILEKIKNNEKIDVFLQKDNGRAQIRDFVDINYVVEIIYNLLIDKEENNIYNIGSGIGYSVKDICDICFDLLGKKTELNYVPGREGDCDFNIANMDKLRGKFDIKNIDIKDTIKNIINNQ